MGDGGCPPETPSYPSLEGLSPLAPYCKLACTICCMTRDMGEDMDPGMNLVEVGRTPKGKVLVDPNREEA